MNKHLHIVTHDIPFPIDFGGVTDLFCKIKALHKDGVNIHLHCFTHKRKEQEILLRYCASVNYYPRKKGWGFIFSQLPYIVYSRRNKQLLKNLQLDDHPILLEGIHCTFHLYKGFFSNRKVALRLHNTEHIYYRLLAKNEKNILKKTYYQLESFLLKKYERKIASKTEIWAVSESDCKNYQSLLALTKISFLPVFIPWNKVNGETGYGNYCLYHGNLEVNENEKAVHWLIDEVFSRIQLPLVIAGKNPSASLKTKIYQYNYCCLIENPDEHEMQDLINKAHLNVLPSFNNTGTKLKLLNALFNGRHCITNQAAIEGTIMDDICIVANNADAFCKLIKDYMNKEFTYEIKNFRAESLKKIYDNSRNAGTIIRWL